MRNLKKFLALVLAMLMIVSAAAVVSADDATFTDVAEDNIYAEAIADLVVKGITQGTGEDTFAPEDGVKRYQMALFIARAATGETEWANQIVPFTDVTEYTGAIYYAYANGIINGYNATTFGPDDAITYIQALKMAVATLGYDVEWEGDWMWPYYNKAVALGLTDGVAVTEFDKALTRAETAQIIYNMIYAAPAEGDVTLADKNFGTIDGVGVESTYVITATPKQAYVKDAQSDKYTATGNAIDVVHVGIQPLVNGVPTGAIKYLPATDINIPEDADVEDYFNRTVTLVNYDAETGAFDRADLGDPATVVNFKDITLSNAGKSIKVADVTYKLATNLTGSYLNNEIVVFDSNINAATAEGYSLIKDEDGNIIDENGFILAKLVVKNSTNWYMYTNNGKQVLISEKEALEEFGYELPAGELDYADYSTMDDIDCYVSYGVHYADEAYELHLYDDDKDGEYERAIYLPIYISNYYTYKSGSYTYDHVVEDVLGAADKTVKAADVTYNSDEELVNGTVFSFTYNALLNEVTVNDVIEPEIKTLKSLKYNKSTGNYTVTFTDASSYTMDAYDTAIGGALLERDHNATAPAYLDDIAAGKYLNYTDVENLIQTREIGEDYAFYAANGYIFFIEKVEEAKDPYEFVVFDTLIDLDLEELYANIWYDGAYKTGASIIQVGKKVIANLNTLQFAKLLDDETWQEYGAVWAAQYADGQFALEAIITNDEDEETLEKYGLVELDENTYGADDEGELTFIGGTTVYDGAGEAITDLGYRLYTDNDTVFYFIDTTKDATGNVDPVEAYKMMPGADAEIGFDAATVIYTDALGIDDRHDNPYGIADTIIVFDATAIEGFEKVVTDYRWITTAGMDSNDLVTGGMAYASDLGLTGYPESLKVYAYTSAHDLADGSETIIYSTFKLDTDKVYKTDKNGVVGIDKDGEETDEYVGGTFAEVIGNGIQGINIGVREVYANFAGGLVYIELGAYGSTAHDFLIEGAVGANETPVTKLILIDMEGDVYEGTDAAKAINDLADDGEYIYWVAGTAADVTSFKDGVAVFVTNIEVDD